MREYITVASVERPLGRRVALLESNFRPINALAGAKILSPPTARNRIFSRPFSKSILLNRAALCRRATAPVHDESGEGEQEKQ